MGTIYESDVPPHIFYEIPGLSPATISLLPHRYLPTSQNIYLVAEVALSKGVKGLHDKYSGYASSASHGIKEEDVLEIALW